MGRADERRSPCRLRMFIEDLFSCLELFSLGWDEHRCGQERAGVCMSYIDLCACV